MIAAHADFARLVLALRVRLRAGQNLRILI